MFEALSIAKYAITKCVKDGCPISNLQLQKILYYIQKLFLGRGKVAFYDKIEAWQFGPVVPTVYYRFCGYGAMPIVMSYDTELTDAGAEDIKEIDRIIEEKRALPPWDLVAETHQKGGAWDYVYHNKSSGSKEITIELIRQLG